MQVALRVVHFKYLIKLIIGLIIGLLSGLYLTIYFCNDGFKQMHKMEIKEFSAKEDVNLSLVPYIKLNRSRYAVTELNIKYKLFVGLMTYTSDLNDFTLFMNKSINEYSNKIIHFVNNPPLSQTKQSTNETNIIYLNNNDNLFDLKALKHIIDNYLDKYEWFFLATHLTFLRASKLLDMVNHLSFTQDIYVGACSNEQSHCSLDSGILISSAVLLKLSQNLDTCFKDADAESLSANSIDGCIRKTLNLRCKEFANGKHISFHVENNFDYDRSIGNLILSPKFNQSLTVTQVKDIVTFKKLQLYFNNVEMDEIDLKILEIEKNIVEIAAHTSEGVNGLHWPLGVPKPLKPTNRYEVLRWEYFNLTHLFFGSDFEVVELMNEYYKQDIDEIISFSMANLNKNSKTPKYEFKELLNGYKQFDPTRGATYILDLILADLETKHEITKRVNLMRPLGDIEITKIITNQTEFSKINLIVTFGEETNQLDILGFLNSFENAVLKKEAIKNFESLSIGYFTLDTSKQDEMFSFLSKMFIELYKNYQIKLDINKILITKSDLFLSEDYRQLVAVEHFYTKLPKDSLILMIPPCTQTNSEFIERVVLNTFKGEQVFFPIAFNGYMPAILANSSLPKQIEIKSELGWFNEYTYEFVSFFNTDYYSLKSLLSKSDILDLNKSLFDLFKDHLDIDILRAPDKDLRCKWRLINSCDKPKFSNEEIDRCNKQRENSLGTSSQLFKILINT